MAQRCEICNDDRGSARYDKRFNGTFCKLCRESIYDTLSDYEFISNAQPTKQKDITTSPTVS